MIVVRIVQALLALVALLWSLYVVVMPLLAGLRRPRVGATAHSDSLPSVAVIVPSHNMENEIEACVAALHSSDYPPELLTIYVVADHCTDETASRGRMAGASLLVRHEDPPGKTYAIAWTLRALAQSGADPDLYVITDATARVDRGFLRALISMWQGGEEVIVGHSLVAITNTKWFAKCLGLTLVHRNLQNWARERLGLSSLIEGRGMAYGRRYVQRFGWSLALPTQSQAGQHPTEDWRHGVRVVENGLRVAYQDDARVYTPLRADLATATRQGVRWERGRQLNAISHGISLLAKGLRDRDRLSLFAALDAIQLPVAVLGVLCVAVAILTLILPNGPLLNFLGIAPVVLIACYGFQITMRGRRDGIPASTLLWAPVYLIWRLSTYVMAWVPLDRARIPQDRPNP